MKERFVGPTIFLGVLSFEWAVLIKIGSVTNAWPL
jgi:hypothetical protein